MCGTVQCVGVYAERAEVHMGLAWIKALTIRTGHANVIKHLDPVLELLGRRAGSTPPRSSRRTCRSRRRPRPTARYAAREALKIVLVP